MLEDINRTFSKCFGWVFTVQPMGLKFFAVLALVACVCALAVFSRIMRCGGCFLRVFL